MDPTSNMPDDPGTDPGDDTSSDDLAAGLLGDEVIGDQAKIDELIDDSLSDEDFENYVRVDDVGDPVGVGAPGPGAPGTGPDGARRDGTLPPPPQQYATSPRRLVRDPYARFSGVASGLAHYLGLEVRLVRVTIIVLTLFSGGLVIPAYLLAWLLMPRATVWPPAPTSDNVLKGIGIDGPAKTIALAVLAITAVGILGGADGPFSIVITLSLILAGIWVLNQRPAPAMAGAAPAASSVGAPSFGTYGDPGQTPPGPGTVPPPPNSRDWAQQHAVPRRSGGRRFLRGAFIGTVILVPLMIIGGAAALFFVVADTDANGFSIDAGDVDVRPLNSADLLNSYETDLGSITLDLTALDDSMFDSGPVDVKVQADLGDIDVIVPEDLSVLVDAQVDAGDIRIFDQQSDGFDAELNVADGGRPSVHLDIQADLGSIEVKR